MNTTYDQDAESALVGEVLLSAWRFKETGITPADFGSPALQFVWESIGSLLERGLDVDAQAVMTECHRNPERAKSIDGRMLMECQFAASGAWRAAAARVLEQSIRRRIRLIAMELDTQAQDPVLDPVQVIDEHVSRLATIERPNADPPPDLRTFEQVANEPETTAPWVIPGILRQGWRAVIVGGEGAGKTWLLTQIAVAASQGLHPFGAHGPDEHIEPQAVVYIDCENPRDAVVTRFRQCQHTARARSRSFDDSRAFLHHRPGGIDIRTRRDRSELEAIFRKVRPTLVCMGPLYKSFRKSARESDEDAVLSTQAVFDDLRTQFGFALVLEHHAPHGDAGRRDMRPIGTSAWLRWPEFGIGLEKTDDKRTLRWTRWRGDRAKAMWPDSMTRGTTYPWPWQPNFDGGN